MFVKEPAEGNNSCHVQSGTIDGVWIGSRIYRTLRYTQFVAALYISLLHTPASTVTSSLAVAR
jgi:hypothetical protein